MTHNGVSKFSTEDYDSLTNFYEWIITDVISYQGCRNVKRKWKNRKNWTKVISKFRKIIKHSHPNRSVYYMCYSHYSYFYGPSSLYMEKKLLVRKTTNFASNQPVKWYQNLACFYHINHLIQDSPLHYSSGISDKSL